MARTRNAGRGRSTKGRGSRGRGGSSKGQSRGGQRGKSDKNSEFVKVGDISPSKKCNDNEEEILEAMASEIENGATLNEVLQNSGLQLWLNFYWPEEGTMEFERKDKVLLTFKEPAQDAPDFNVATASFSSE